jgi:hypothetical protein
MKTRKLHYLSGLTLLVAVLAAGPAWSEEYNDNVVIVLDASGSMKGSLQGSGLNKMAAAKSALKAVLKKVPQSTRIGLLVFSASNLQDDWAYPLGPRDDAALSKAIDRPEPGSGTPLGQYIKVGADRLLQERAKQYGYGSYRLLIVTDGEAQDQDLVDSYTPDVIARGITVDVIGVGMKGDHTLARKAHSYRRANDPSALSRAVAEVFAEVSIPVTDLAHAEAFDLIAPIPNQVAVAIIQALSTSGNHAIGEKPKPAPQPSPSSGMKAPAPSIAVTVPTAVGGNAPSQTQGKGFPLWKIIIIVAVILLAFRRLVARKGHRK